MRNDLLVEMIKKISKQRFNKKKVTEDGSDTNKNSPGSPIIINPTLHSIDQAR